MEDKQLKSDEVLVSIHCGDKTDILASMELTQLARLIAALGDSTVEVWPGSAEADAGE